MRIRVCIMVAALAISACGGENGVTTLPPPVPVDSIGSLKILSSAGDTLVGVNPAATFSAQAVSSQGGSVSYVWTNNGTVLGSGNNLSLAMVRGMNRVCVTASVASSEKSACMNVVFIPGTTIRVVSADPTNEVPLQQMSLTLSKGADTATCQTDPGGLCTVRSNLVLQDSVKYFAPPGLYNKMEGYIAHSDFLQSGGVTFIAIPAQYRIASGVFVGMMVPTGLDPAYTAGSDNLSFYIRGAVPQAGGRIWYSDLTLATSSMPIPVNILVKPERISDAGVTTIRTALDSLNKILGWNLTQAAVVKDTAYWARGAIVITLDSTACKSTSDIIFSACAGYDIVNGEIDGGGFTFTSASSITVHVTLHEMLHVLGFGHGCSWHSIMNAYCDWLKVFPDFPNPMDSLTPTDVAYIELMYRIRNLERKYNTQFSLCEAYQGENCTTIHP